MNKPTPEQLHRVARRQFQGTVIISLGALALLALVGGPIALWGAVLLATVLALIGIALALTAHLKIAALEDQNLELARSLRMLRENFEGSILRR